MCATILYHNKLQQMCLTKGSSMTELQELRRYRRDLHRIPELDFDLPQTIAYIEGVLSALTVAFSSGYLAGKRAVEFCG